MRRSASVMACVALLMVIGTFSATMPVFSEGTTCVYVTETGHNVHGALLNFYVTHNGVENFGVPLTEAFMEEGILVQYFTRARLEFNPRNPEANRVQVSTLGTKYGVTDPPVRSNAIPPANNPNFRYFPDSGLYISLMVKDYFDTHGGLDILGYPISLIRYESGTFVQYFQRARLEWTPSVKVHASSLGQTALVKKYPTGLRWSARIANDWCTEIKSSNNWLKIAATSSSLSASTSIPPNTNLDLLVRVRYRQTGPKGPQYVDVTVDDQQAKPIAGAGLYAIVHFANGDRAIPLLPTDRNGKASFSFDVSSQPPNYTTLVEVFAYAGTLSASARDTFTR